MINRKAGARAGLRITKLQTPNSKLQTLFSKPFRAASPLRDGVRDDLHWVPIPQQDHLLAPLVT
jgi:hypothetical protein